MHTNYTEQITRDDSTLLRYHKVIDQDKILSCIVAFDGERMIGYQKDLFEDFLTNLVDVMSAEDVGIKTCKKAFEEGLKDINMKIQVFNEKMDDDAFPMIGSVQMIIDSDYLASFIGQSGLIILREWRLQYMVTNSTGEEKVSQFSELIEWEVTVGDTIITCGFPVETYLDKEDVLTIVGTAQAEEQPLLDAFLDVLKVRLEEDAIRFLTQIELESAIEITKKKIRNRIDWPFKIIIEKVWGIERFQGWVLYGLIGIVGALLLYGLVQSFMAANTATFTESNGQVVMDITIEDIQKDIGRFQKIDPSSDQKIKKYNEIVNKLDTLDANNKWTYDVNELRKILETEYYKWFNIVLANNDSFFKEQLYAFTQQEKNTFLEPQELFYTDSLMVAWREWVLLGAINDQLRGTLISAGIDQKIKACSFNLLRNGLYCVTDDNAIFNIVKAWFQPVTTDSWAFPTNIVDLGRFGSSNMYVLSDDPWLNSDRTFVARYTNKLGSQENFGEVTQYPLIQKDDLSYASGWFASMAIDSTFLAWSRATKELVQMWRPWVATTLESRVIPLLGGDTVEPYSINTQVIASQESRFVYLFDEDNQSFTVYRSQPYKTNDANTTSFQLSYFFRIKFGMTDMPILDVYVEEGEKSNLLMLTKDGVYKLRLHEYIEQFFAKENA